MMSRSIDVQLPELMHQTRLLCLAIRCAALPFLCHKVAGHVEQFLPKGRMHIGDRGQITAHLFGQTLLGYPLLVELIQIDVIGVGVQLNDGFINRFALYSHLCSTIHSIIHTLTDLKISARINGLIIEMMRSKNDTTLTTCIWHSLPGSPSCK